MMRGYLLDTCVLSEFTRPKPAHEVLGWLDAQNQSSLYLSVITIAEIEQGIAHLAAGSSANKLELWLRDSVIVRFQSRTLDVDRAVASRWGRMRGNALRSGHPLALVDSLLAASALEHDLTVATRNVKDFAPMGVEVVNPWSP